MSKKDVVKKRKINYRNLFVIIKILIIVIIISGFYLSNKTFENSISLLAVSEDNNGISREGSIIDLNLKVRPGSGQTYVNMNTINDIDTQISIINSQKIACDLFELDCQNYDFYYNFEGSALVLKGPSASSAIAILTAKTLNSQFVDDSTVITGSLNSGGIMGNVGGIDEKIRVAENQGFSKVVIPVFSDYNESIEHDIEVSKAIDIIEAYNHFGGQDFFPRQKEIDKSNYLNLMSNLSNLMCDRSVEIRDKIDINAIDENSSLYAFAKQTLESYNSSMIAKEKGNFYSQGSFCYNSNLNARVIVERQRNLSMQERDIIIGELEHTLNKKYIILNSKEYLNNIETINDFYVYLLILDRLEEGRDFLKQTNELEFDYDEDNISVSQENQTNQSLIVITHVNNMPKNYDDVKIAKENLYAYAIERYYTVTLWESFITHQGEKIKFDNEKINEACLKINREISIKSELLRNYGVGYFNTEISEQNQFSSDFANKYLCVYRGLELNGKINAVLNSVGIEDGSLENYTKRVLDIANLRLTSLENENFPLIPYIYLEYSEDLLEQGDFSSAMLYTNYALSYGDLDLYLEKEDVQRSMFNENMRELFEMDFISLMFVVPLLIILAFL